MELEIVNHPEDGLVAVDKDGERHPVPVEELDVQKTHSESVNTIDTHTGSVSHVRDGVLYPNSPRTFGADGWMPLKPYAGVDNPVLSDGIDSAVDGLADPFIRQANGRIYILAERFNSSSYEDIAAVSTTDLRNYTYEGVVLSDNDNVRAYPLHYQMPDGDWVMSPAIHPDGPDDEWRLYETTSDDYPHGPGGGEWEYAESPLTGSEFGSGDPTPFFANGRWWYLVKDGNGDVRFYYADEAEDLRNRDWTEHPDSATADLNNISRCRGTPVVRDDDVLVFGQPDVTEYRLTDLTTDSVTVSEGPQIIGAEDNGAWNSDLMHHVDMLMPREGPPIVAVDGFSEATASNYDLGLYTVSDQLPELVRCYATTDQTVPSGAGLEDVELDSVSHDVLSQPALSTDRIFTHTDGYYEIHGAVTLRGTSNVPYRGAVAVVQSDNDKIAESHFQVGQNDFVSASVSTTCYLPAGEPVKLRMQQFSGDSIDTLSEEDNVYLEMRKIH